MSRNDNTNRLLLDLARVFAAMLIFSALTGPSQENQTRTPILSWAFLSGNPILLLPLLALAGTGAVWWVVSREPLERAVSNEGNPRT